MKLIFTKSAQMDLIRLREFIASKNPQAANRIAQRLKKAIEQLEADKDMDIMTRGWAKINHTPTP